MDVKVVIEMTADEVEKLSRPTRGQGGFQSLLRRLQSQLSNESELVLSLVDVKTIVKYQAKYGSGGFQGRLDAVLSALSRLASALSFRAA